MTKTRVRKTIAIPPSPAMCANMMPSLTVCVVPIATPTPTVMMATHVRALPVSSTSVRSRPSPVMMVSTVHTTPVTPRQRNVSIRSIQNSAMSPVLKISIATTTTHVRPNFVTKITSVSGKLSPTVCPAKWMTTVRFYPAKLTTCAVDLSAMCKTMSAVTNTKPVTTVSVVHRTCATAKTAVSSAHLWSAKSVATLRPIVMTWIHAQTKPVTSSPTPVNSRPSHATTMTRAPSITAIPTMGNASITWSSEVPARVLAHASLQMNAILEMHAC